MKAASKHSLDCLGHEKEMQDHGWVQNLADFSETLMDNFIIIYIQWSQTKHGLEVKVSFAGLE